MANCRRKLRSTLIAAIIFVSSFALQNTPPMQDRKKSLVFHGFNKNEEEREGKELGALTKKGER